MRVVHAINNLAASSGTVITLLRRLVLRCLENSSNFQATHIRGVKNILADALSRFDFTHFFSAAPHAQKQGEPFPVQLWQLGTQGNCSS
ncbi:hypothetical protein XELAEV_18047309mg [Xenopus laevis]|uniref:Uncharacterized protein n=1 Tax=Xenopus laevis TaxID=8355 RepID=A0A974BUX7_XENLA|nr:hypothetical protein XELAEV_18047309mg [Xenopus laevis]